jgi:phage tail sheath protein FI
VNLGETVAAFTSVAGTDGTVADSDYTGTGKPLQIIAAYPGVAIVYCAEYMSATLQSAMETEANASSDRLFLIGPTSHTVNVAAAITDVASFRHDRIVYCYNHVYTTDPETATDLLVRPESWMANVLANTDVDIHPGEEDTKRFLAGITRLYQPSITRADYVLLRAAGICALETDLGSPVFVSGVVTSLTPLKTEITRRRMADFLQLSAAYTLRFHVKKKNTAERRRAIAATLKGWLSNLQRAGRVVEDYNIDTEILNNAVDRAAGVERILMQVKLVGHMLHIVLQTEIGTSVSITAQ